MSSLPQRSVDGGAELADGIAFGQVQRRDGRASASLVDAILDLLQRLCAAGDEDDVSAFAARASAVAAPMPRLAPVTSASLPSRGFESVIAERV